MDLPCVCAPPCVAVTTEEVTPAAVEASVNLTAGGRQEAQMADVAREPRLKTGGHDPMKTRGVW